MVLLSPPYSPVRLLAGRGLFPQKNARALAPRGLLQSSYVFFVLNLGPYGYTKKSARASRPAPGATRKKRSAVTIANTGYKKGLSYLENQASENLRRNMELSPIPTNRGNAVGQFIHGWFWGSFIQFGALIYRSPL